uniref:Uncharacterized protein n=1 Tax=Panagrolaimus sp. ES5 TaxID=591445 RepID=A0AC34GVD9_9BILA
MYPNSNHTAPTPDSNYAPSPQSNSRTMTPNHYSQPAFKQEQTQMWLQNYHGPSSSSGNPSPAPSVMSAMTQLSGLSAITVNTHVTNMSQMPNFNNNFNMQHGPLSSNSHCENVDPKSDLCLHAADLLNSLSDDDREIRIKTTPLLNVVIKRLKDTRNVPEQLIEKILKKVILVLQREKDEQLQIQLATIVSDMIRRQGQLTFVKDLFNFYNCVDENAQSYPRFLRHLFPALYQLFTCSQIEHELIRLGKATFYWTQIRNFAHYFMILKALLKRNEALRIKVLQMNIINILLDITKRNIDVFNPQSYDQTIAETLKTCHSAVMTTLENLLSSKIENLPDELVKNHTIQIIISAMVLFNPFLSQASIFRTYLCLGQMAHSKEIVNIHPVAFKTNYDLATIINEDLKKAMAKSKDLVAEILKFLCNVTRNDYFISRMIDMGYYDTILRCLEIFLPHCLQQEYFEMCDNLLFILSKLSLVKHFVLRDKILSKLASPQVCELFLKIIKKGKSTYILRILRIWKTVLIVNPVALQPDSTVFYLLECIREYWCRNPLLKDDILMIKTATEILKLLASVGLCKEAIMKNVSPSELIGFLNQQENIELISAMLALIFDLWQHCVELRNHEFSGPEMRILLERFANLNNLELSNQAQAMLNRISNETDDFVPALAVAFNPQNINYPL